MTKIKREEKMSGVGRLKKKRKRREGRDRERECV